MRLFLLLFVSTALLIAGSQAIAREEPEVRTVPQELMQAKTVFVENRSGYVRARDEFANELGKWNRFRIVYHKADADMLVILTAKTAQKTTKLAFVDPRSGEKVWTNTMKWSDDGAVRDIMAGLRQLIEGQEK